MGGGFRVAMMLGCAIAMASGCASGGPTGLPGNASEVISEGNAVREFQTAGQLAATSTYVVRGSVREVVRGSEVTFPDGSGESVTPRVLVFDVDDYLFIRDAATGTPGEIQIVDGYWQNDVGYHHEEVDWAQPGDRAIFFLSNDRAPDGSFLPTFTPLGSEGRLLIDASATDFDDTSDSVWASLPASATVAQLEEAAADAVQRATSGEARPVLVTVCFPSDPQDEASQPRCMKE